MRELIHFYTLVLSLLKVVNTFLALFLWVFIRENNSKVKVIDIHIKRVFYEVYT
jgi:hypothetical protein